MSAVIVRNELFTVVCTGCLEIHLGGSGEPSDPVLDVTYDDLSKTFVCSHCYTNSNRPQRHTQYEIAGLVRKYFGTN